MHAQHPVIRAPCALAASGPGSRIRRFGWSLLAPLVIVALFLVSLQARGFEPSREDRIKAAIVYKVGKFVDWPSSAFPTPDAPLTICLLGDDDFAAALQGVAGRTVQGRRIDFRIIGVSSMAKANACHILFLPRSASGRVGSIARTLRGKPVLTISDIPGFARSGGMISLVRIGNRIGFEIAPDAARASGLSVRAQLLDLAELVGQ